MSSTQEGEQPSGYPRVYRVDAKTRHIINWGAAIFCGLFLLITVVSAIRHPEQYRSVGGLFSLFLVNGFIDSLMIGACLRTFSYVILHEDVIEVTGFFSTRRLRRDEIRGWRLQSSGYPVNVFFYIIVPLDKGTKELKLPPYLHVDKFFYAWKKTIPKVKK